MLVRATPTFSHLRFSIVAALLAVAPVVSAQTQQWKPFGTAAEGFQILFPSTPETGKSSISAGADAYELRSYSAEVGSAVFYVGVCDYGLKGRAADAGKILADAEKAATSHISAAILNEKKIILDAGSGGNPQSTTTQGIEYEAASDRLHFITRMYVAGGVLYQITESWPVNETFADTARFLDSFRLLPHSVQ